MADNGDKNGNGKKISSRKTLDGKLDLDITSQHTEINRIYVTDPAGRSRKYVPVGTDVITEEMTENEVHRMFGTLRDENLSDNQLVQFALDYLIQRTGAKYAFLQMSQANLPTIDGEVTRVYGKEPTTDEANDVAGFKEKNKEFNIDLFDPEDKFYRNLDIELLGGTTGSGFTTYLTLKEKEETVGAVQLLGTKELNEYDMAFITTWIDEADTLFSEILKLEEKVAKRVEEALEKKSLENTPIPLVDEEEQREMKSKEVDIPGRGYQTGSPFDRKKVEINNEYELIVGLSGSRIPNFMFNLEMDSPEIIYGDNARAREISEFSAKLTLAVIDDAIARLVAEAKSGGCEIRWGNFTKEQYKDAAVFNALYVISPLYMKRPDGSPLYPQLEKEKDMDRISTFLSGMTSAKFRNFKGDDRQLGILAGMMAGKMDGKAEPYRTGKIIDALTYITNLVEAIRHYSNYTKKSDLIDRNDSNANKEHRGVEGIEYLMDKGYLDYSPIIGRTALCEQAYVGFQGWYQEKKDKLANPEAHANGTQTNGNQIKKKNGRSGDIQDIVRDDAIIK